MIWGDNVRRGYDIIKGSVGTHTHAHRDYGYKWNLQIILEITKIYEAFKIYLCSKTIDDSGTEYQFQISYRNTRSLANEDFAFWNTNHDINVASSMQSEEWMPNKNGEAYALNGTGSSRS